MTDKPPASPADRSYAFETRAVHAGARPAPRRRCTTCEPMYPAPPVTRTLIVVGSHDRRAPINGPLRECVPAKVRAGTVRR